MKFKIPILVFAVLSGLVSSGCGGIKYSVHKVKEWEGPVKFKSVSLRKGKSKLFVEEKKGVFLQEFSTGLVSSNSKVAEVTYRESEETLQVYVKGISKGTAHIYYIKREPGVFGYQDPDEIDIRKWAKKSPRFKIIVR